MLGLLFRCLFMVLVCTPVMAEQFSDYDVTTGSHRVSGPGIGKTESFHGALGFSGVPLYGGDGFSQSLVLIDPSNAAVETIGILDTPLPAAFAYDSTTNLIYVTDTSTDNLLLVVPSTGETSLVGYTGVGLMHGAAIDPESGVLYVSSQEPYNTTLLYSIDKSTGTASFIGDMGVPWVAGLDFDPTSGILYGAVGGPEPMGAIVTIDTATGHATIVAPSMRFAGITFTDDGQLLGVENWENQLFLVDPDDGSYSLIGDLTLENMLAIVFGGEDPVTVESISWGSLKANYRLPQEAR